MMPYIIVALIIIVSVGQAWLIKTILESK